MAAVPHPHADAGDMMRRNPTPEQRGEMVVERLMARAPSPLRRWLKGAGGTASAHVAAVVLTRPEAKIPSYATSLARDDFAARVLGIDPEEIWSGDYEKTEGGAAKYAVLRSQHLHAVSKAVLAGDDISSDALHSWGAEDIDWKAAPAPWSPSDPDEVRERLWDFANNGVALSTHAADMRQRNDVGEKLADLQKQGVEAVYRDGILATRDGAYKYARGKGTVKVKVPGTTRKMMERQAPPTWQPIGKLRWKDFEKVLAGYATANFFEPELPASFNRAARNTALYGLAEPRPADMQGAMFHLHGKGAPPPKPRQPPVPRGDAGFTAERVAAEQAMHAERARQQEKDRLNAEAAARAAPKPPPVVQGTENDPIMQALAAAFSYDAYPHRRPSWPASATELAREHIAEFERRKDEEAKRGST